MDVDLNPVLGIVVIHYLNIVVNLLSFYTDGEQASFWTLVSRVVQSLCYASTTLITCVFIRYYMRVDGEYHVTFDPPQQHLPPAAAAAEQLPPPPSEMDVLGLVRVCGICFLAGPRCLL
jgi:hypothetical protein